MAVCGAGVDGRDLLVERQTSSNHIRNRSRIDRLQGRKNLRIDEGLRIVQMTTVTHK